MKAIQAKAPDLERAGPPRDECTLFGWGAAKHDELEERRGQTRSPNLLLSTRRLHIAWQTSFLSAPFCPRSTRALITLVRRILKALMFHSDVIMIAQ